MTTIREHLEPRLAAAAKARVTKLEKLNAPAVVIARAGQGAKVGKMAKFGNREVVSIENREYRRGYGAEFACADGSTVWMIPGPYGLFLTDQPAS